jgi:hypothetical protein
VFAPNSQLVLFDVPSLPSKILNARSAIALKSWLAKLTHT